MTQPNLHPHTTEPIAKPRNQHDQVDQELWLCPTTEDLRDRLTSLKEAYVNTPCMQSMREFAEFMAAIRHDEEAESEIDSDFYDGMQMAVHVNLAPAHENLQRFVRGTYFMPTFTDADGEQVHATQVMRSWASDGWHEFYIAQEEAYRDRAMAITDRLYPSDSSSAASHFSFLLGYTFASNFVWTGAKEYRTKTLA